MRKLTLAIVGALIAFGAPVPGQVKPAQASFLECQNQNPVDPECEPYTFLDIKILPGPAGIPQFVYQPRVSNPTGSDDSANYRGVGEHPLGYVVTALGPMLVQPDPVKTYWVRNITNLTGEKVTVAKCVSQLYTNGIPRCTTNSSPFEYVIPKGETKTLYDPSSYNGSYPENYFPGASVLDPSHANNVDVEFELTLLEHRQALGRLVFHRYNCATPDQQNFCPKKVYDNKYMGLPPLQLPL